MDVAIRHSPSFAAARVTLDPNEQIRAESGAMMATSSGVGITSSTQGGVMKGLKRSVLGGESLFVSTFSAPASGGWVDVAHHLPGDIVTTTVSSDRPLSITKGVGWRPLPRSSWTPSGAASRTSSGARAGSSSGLRARARSCWPATAPSTPSSSPTARR